MIIFSILYTLSCTGYYIFVVYATIKFIRLEIYLCSVRLMQRAPLKLADKIFSMNRRNNSVLSVSVKLTVACQ